MSSLRDDEALNILHGQVFTLSEIRRIVDRYGIPDAEWRSDSTRKYDLFIEAQAWGQLWLNR
ncbi:MAG: hypothetical protein ACFBSF_21700 [Leptolyngbyaceae cyanobacterium]